jgi:hypothetical protein
VIFALEEAIRYGRAVLYTRWCDVATSERASTPHTHLLAPSIGVCSHFDANLIVRVYFVCVIAYFMLTILVEGGHLDADRFTEYQLSIGCNVG